MLVRPLITTPLRKLFSADTNIRPEDTFDGKIIIIDIPVQEFRLVGRIANLVWKYCFQIAVLRRMQPAEKDKYLRPVFLWADEAQNFVSGFDAQYQAVARSAGGCTVYLTQNRESFRRAMKNNDAVDSLLGNLQAKFFCQNSGETNEWASRLLGQHWIKTTSTSAGQSRNQATAAAPEQASHNSGVSRADQCRLFVEPSRFTTLKRGGALHGFQVEAIVYNGGNLFFNGKEALPYRLITFNQR
jgi:type IV secretory pathway TraG/TraD family ATPase VirD4